MKQKRKFLPSLKVLDYSNTSVEPKIVSKGLITVMKPFIAPSLSEKYPGIAALWAYDLNGNAIPSAVSSASKRQYWFRCEKNHTWPISIQGIVKANGTCGYCKHTRPSREYCLATEYPLIAAELHETRNGSLTAYDLLPASGKMVWWKCSKCGEDYPETPNKRTSAKEGCACCQGRKVSNRNRLSILRPDLLKYFDYNKNECSPDDVSIQSDKWISWLCEKGHSFRVRVKTMVRAKRNGCKYCYGRAPSKEHNLAVKFPDIASLWNYELNKGKPEDYSPNSNKKAYFNCPTGIASHIHRIKICNKVRYKRCPHCYPKLSLNEARIYTELKTIFSDATRYKNGRDELDIFVPQLSLGIEYDGRYYHRNRIKKDTKKNITFNEKNIKVIRLREHPLPHISPLDISLRPEKFSKSDVNSLLEIISKNFTLTSAQEKSISEYIAKNCFVNEEAYQEMIVNHHLPPKGRSLFERNPILAAEWDPFNNGRRTIHNTYGNAKYNAAWICKMHGTFRAVVDKRMRGTGCPNCKNKLISIRLKAYQERKRKLQ